MELRLEQVTGILKKVHISFSETGRQANLARLIQARFLSTAQDEMHSGEAENESGSDDASLQSGS